MIYRTENYAELENLTEAQKYIVATVTFSPHIIVKRCSLLLSDFLQTYMDSREERKKLICELQYKGEHVAAQLFSILEQLFIADKQLDECQGIEQTIE